MADTGVSRFRLTRRRRNTDGGNTRRGLRIGGKSLIIKTIASLVGVCAFACVSPVVAQTVAAVGSTPVASIAVPTPAPGTAVLRAGTSIPLRTVTGLTTEGKKLAVGYRFELETIDAVKVNGAVVIPVGSRAIGEVTQVRNKGMWGKSGGITARLLYVSVEGRQLRLSGTMDDKGVTGTAGVVAAVAFVPVVGFFVTGTSAKIPVGSNVTGFLEEDVPVAITLGVAPAPLAVTQPAPVGATAPTTTSEASKIVPVAAKASSAK